MGGTKEKVTYQSQDDENISYRRQFTDKVTTALPCKLELNGLALQKGGTDPRGYKDRMLLRYLLIAKS